MEVLDFWWVMLLLLDRQSSGTANIPARNPRGYQVSGIQGGSVLLPVVLTSSERVAKIEWKFQPQTGLDLTIAEFTGGKLKRLNPGDRFGQRLEMADEATLRITGLEIGDSGVYVARVRLASAVVEAHSFTCWVYEPVPEPQIFHRLVSRTAEVCNVTLKCLGSERGGIKVSWKRGDQPGVLKEVPDRDRLSANSTDFHVSWQPDSMDSTFTCLHSNSINQKSASLDLATICRSEGVSGCLSWARVAMLVGVLVQILTVASLNVLERIKKKQNWIQNRTESDLNRTERWQEQRLGPRM